MNTVHRRVAIALIASTILMGSVATAAIIRVPEDQPTLAAAVAAAAPGDEIVAQPGTYALGGGLYVDFGLTITSATAGEYVDIDLQGDGAIFINCEAETTILRWVAIRNGDRSGLVLEGPMYLVDDADVLLEHCLITENTGNWGAGIAITRNHWHTGTLTFRDCEISGNQATNVLQGGGGIGAPTSNGANRLVLERVTIRDNSSAGDGGGLWLAMPCEASDCVIEDNSAAGDGGGILVGTFDGNTTTFDRCTIDGNAAGGYGGGFGTSDEGAVAFHFCQFASNTATGGPDGWVSAGIEVLLHCCEFLEGGIEAEDDTGLIIDDSDCGTPVTNRSLSRVKSLFR